MRAPLATWLFFSIGPLSAACAPQPPDYVKTLAAWSACPPKPGAGIAVLGAVSRPGQVALSNGRTLVRAISYSGGLSVLAYKRSVTVRRCDKVVMVNLDAIIEEGAADPAMMDGDVVFVSERD